MNKINFKKVIKKNKCYNNTDVQELCPKNEKQHTWTAWNPVKFKWFPTQFVVGKFKLLI